MLCLVTLGFEMQPQCSHTHGIFDGDTEFSQVPGSPRRVSSQEVVWHLGDRPLEARCPVPVPALSLASEHP